MYSNVGLVDDWKRRQQRRRLRVVCTSELASMARTNVLLYVPIKSWPKVSLHYPFLGFELTIVSREGRPVGLLKDLGS